MTTTWGKAFVVTSVAVMLVSAACSPDTNVEQLASSTGGGTTIEVKDNAFEATNVTVKQGDIVTWVNRDRVTHTIVSGEPGARTVNFVRILWAQA